VEVQNAHKILFQNPEIMRAFLGTINRREDAAEIDLREIGCAFVDWIQITQNRV
jgi:hypothetical protein